MNKRNYIPEIFSTTEIPGQLVFTCKDCGEPTYCNTRNKRYYLKGICTECKVSPDSNKYKSLYARWFGMKQRCYNPKDKNYDGYGGRGVTICDEWLNDKEAFFNWAKANGYKEELDLDKDIGSAKYKIDPPIYSPKTCMFVTAQHNSQATRKLIASNTTGYRGVARTQIEGMFIGSIMINGERIELGKSKFPLELAIKYDNYVRKHKLAHTTNNISQTMKNKMSRYKEISKKLTPFSKKIREKTIERDRINRQLNNEIEELEVKAKRFKDEKARLLFDLKPNTLAV